MTHLTEHEKTILRAIADEKPIELQNSKGDWVPAERELVYDWLRTPNRLRIAPETRSINGVAFAAPKRDLSKYQLVVQSNFNKREPVNYGFAESEDRDAAYNAIIDALEGRTK